MKHTGEETEMSVVAMTPDKIHHEISKHISRGVPYIDALVDFAEKNNVEIETIAQIVKKSSILREKVKSEAIKLKMVRKDETDLTDLCE